jgi:hypothetical protein
VGRNAVVLTKSGEKLEGLLTAADENGCTLFYKQRELVPGKKSKQWVEYNQVLSYEDIKETKITISFK